MMDLADRMSQPAYLRAQADRCFRLAQGMGSLEQFEELEAIGRAFESEAAQIETAFRSGESAARL